MIQALPRMHPAATDGGGDVPIADQSPARESSSGDDGPSPFSAILSRIRLRTDRGIRSRVLDTSGSRKSAAWTPARRLHRPPRPPAQAVRDRLEISDEYLACIEGSQVL